MDALKRRGIYTAGAVLVVVLLSLVFAQWPAPDVTRFRQATANERDRIMAHYAESGRLIGLTRAEAEQQLGPPDEWDVRLIYSIDAETDSGLVVIFDAENNVTAAQISAAGIGSVDGDVAFSAGAWTQSPANRVAMARGLARSKALIGMSRERILQELGTPSASYGPSAIYDGRGANGDRRISGKSLWVNFDSAGRVASAEYAGS